MPHAALVEFLLRQHHNLVETAGSLIARLLPRSIHAVTTIPYQNNFAGFACQSLLKLLQKLHHSLGGTGPIFPDKAVPIGES